MAHHTPWLRWCHVEMGRATSTYQIDRPLNLEHDTPSTTQASSDKSIDEADPLGHRPDMQTQRCGQHAATHRATAHEAAVNQSGTRADHSPVRERRHDDQVACVSSPLTSDCQPGARRAHQRIRCGRAERGDLTGRAVLQRRSYARRGEAAVAAGELGVRGAMILRDPSRVSKLDDSCGLGRLLSAWVCGNCDPDNATRR
ncbi:uncharacterized protein K452DRAFT_305463 [Aplosporella prunicola CBS 121167]|uniref:Uncharacterized protein n=1 Tax=Aplosporella prunicola CBS 121167 TaxID=1176127 RepID=A0A6A6BMU1_9PEZI|nr:uncharacterized protein K452DRAFT_305463 [Aplosporella prunicola CBS 121167]KAF2145440.1 hypothetical protein K452DRAFT_305463 [Aplosporella prunicola CBS 121167]